MCALLLLALSLLGGFIMLGPGIAGPSLPTPPPGGIEHDGYVLVCEGVPEEACREEADAIAGDLGPDREIGWILIRPDGHEVCWTGTHESGCQDTIGGTPARSPEP